MFVSYRDDPARSCAVTVATFARLDK